LEERLKLSDFDYHLPQGMIAQHPIEPRDGSRMMVLRRPSGIEHRQFRDFPSFLEPSDVLVLNDTRVIPARLLGRRSTGAQIEVLLIHPLNETTWRCMVNPGRKVRPGDTINFSPELSGEVVSRTEGGTRAIRFSFNGNFEGVLERTGLTPLPPYIKRNSPEEGDRLRYQTVYAEKAGAVAAPTAGLHFTENILEEVRSRGVRIARLTLHVGPGTFQPVKVEEIEKHRMDSEWYEVGTEAAETINAARSAGGRLVAVGTTAVRTLESVWDERSAAIMPGSGWTNLFIRPGHRFRAVDALLTNFHLPRSTLLMLVSAFAGRERILAAYEEAIRAGYRFYSYGDCMLIL
jgi:S-adenosylmethionine:tRNA ribosyltransferase-isomerase